MVKRQLQWALTIFVGIVVIIGGGSLLVRHTIWPQIQRLPFMSNNQVIPFHEHHGLDPEVSSLVFGQALLQTSDAPPPILEDGVIYLPVAFLTYHFDRFLFWDASAQILITTTHDEMLVFHPGQPRFYINGFPHDMESPVLQVDGNIFMPACLAEGLYPIVVRHYAGYNVVVVENARLPYTSAELTGRTNIRYRPDNHSPVAVRASSGSRITVFEENGDFTRVRNEDGLLGWVPTSSIRNESVSDSHAEILDRDTILADFVNYTVPRPPNRLAGQPVVMAWDHVGEQTANYARMQVSLYGNLNVIAPTWFSLDGANISSLGSLEYVQWAHAQSVQVWPTFEVSPGNIRPFLTDRAVRQRAINQLVNFVDELSLDGINIDFEPIGSAEGPYFIQFLRELALRLRMRNVVLSVNAAAHESAFYRRELLAYTVDFVILLAQDEHGQDAESSGPVASLPFVQRSIENLLAYVPHEQLVLGLPFYNRIWREVVGNNTPQTRQTRHFGTAYTREWFEYNGASWEWLPEIGSYYGRFADLEDDEIVHYRVWLECERSMSEKLQIFRAHDLAGVAVWNRNFRHNEELWEVMKRFFP